MKKSDLVAGKHILETREGEKYLVCGNLLLSSSRGFNLLEDYNEDLIMESSVRFDVVRVYEAKCLMALEYIMNNDNIKLVWERREKLTDFKKQIVEHLVYRFKYIARDKDDSLYVYNQEPEKHSNGWEIDEYEVGVSRMGDLEVFNYLFPMIKWSDEEPTLISDLLNGCD